MLHPCERARASLVCRARAVLHPCGVCSAADQRVRSSSVSGAAVSSVRKESRQQLAVGVRAVRAQSESAASYRPASKLPQLSAGSAMQREACRSKCGRVRMRRAAVSKAPCSSRQCVGAHGRQQAREPCSGRRCARAGSSKQSRPAAAGSLRMHGPKGPCVHNLLYRQCLRAFQHVCAAFVAPAASTRSTWLAVWVQQWAWQ
jgi:hypothetical protein